MSRYTDWAIPAQFCCWSDVISSLNQGGLDGLGVLNAIKKGGNPLKILVRQKGFEGVEVSGKVTVNVSYRNREEECAAD